MLLKLDSNTNEGLSMTFVYSRGGEKVDNCPLVDNGIISLSTRCPPLIFVNHKMFSNIIKILIRKYKFWEYLNRHILSTGLTLESLWLSDSYND